jgi:hypothetical protein
VRALHYPLNQPKPKDDLLDRAGLTPPPVDVVEDGNALRIVPVENDPSRGRRLIRRMRGRASTKLSTDELMELVRGD